MIKRKYCIISLIISGVACLLQACATSVPSPEAGVPKSLAITRAEALGKVEYDLRFRIPESQDEAVTCHDSVSFEMTDKDPVWLDFQGDSLISEARVNGHRAHLRVEDEHIRIPEKFLRKGGNSVVLDVVCSDLALNRREDYMYTLFVPDHARSAFPCFDQPDLKARFTLSLDVPEGWKAISDGADQRPGPSSGGRQILTFAPTDLIPTYLFSFTAGRFEESSAIVEGKTIRALYREKDPAKVAQLDTVFSEIGLSLRWLEKYTGIRYPFQKYGFVVLPGYQFGGMEHPGAVQYNDNQIFLGQDPTPQEEMRRLELLAHETTHMWFGDLVTMKWFDDVWTKEVFANYMASKISRERFPNVDRDLDFLRSYHGPAIAVDRTDGTHPILQELGNLSQAGLLYGNIIYDKSPIMLRKLEQLMGEDAFRDGLRNYLKKYSYGNATWDNLVSCLEDAAPDKGIGNFSNAWVKEKGMPTIKWTVSDGNLTVSQTDPFGKGVRWPQTFLFGIRYGKEIFPESVVMDGDSYVIKLPSGIVPDLVLPNMDGSGYGFFSLPGGQEDALALLSSIPESGLTPAGEYGIYATVYENYLHGGFDPAILFPAFMARLMDTENPLLAGYIVSCTERFLLDAPAEKSQDMEEALEKAMDKHPVPAVRQQIMRWISTHAQNPSTLEYVYDAWKKRSVSYFGEKDYMATAWHLAVMFPDRADAILTEQRGRLGSEDRRSEFDFVSVACSPEEAVRDSLFRSLLAPEGRSKEAWAQEALALLNDPAREPANNKYILPALEDLPEIQATSSIFFPSSWCASLLGGHRSKEAAELVRKFLSDDVSSPEPLSHALRDKLLQNTYMLLR